ncbi:MAG: AAA family ATPase, partial [bacterium]|nr:AAA family ATPase [bacterium]
MPDTTANIDIIRTKLHRPPVTNDLVPRTQLLERLEYRRQRPLTLISAPAGYGKSTLASSWLEASEHPGAWVSLDAEDSDLRLFLTYLTAAIHTLFPEAVQQTQALLNAVELPPQKVLARTLLNELAQIQEPFVLVLDDYSSHSR